MAAQNFGGAPDRTKDICQAIEKWGGGKPLPIQFGGAIKHGSPGSSAVNLSVEQNSYNAFAALSAAGFTPQFTATTKVLNRGTPMIWADAAHDDSTLELNETAIAKITVTGEALREVLDLIPKWETEVPIPVTSRYRLPLPKARLFGKQTFALQVSGAGAIQKLQYASSGAAEGADSFAALAKALGGPTTAEKAAALKAEADLIAQQQRLVACQADPSVCK